MRMIVKCEPADCGELLDWIENQDILTVEVDHNYNTQEEELDGHTTVTIDPHFDDASAEQQVHFALELLRSGFCK